MRALGRGLAITAAFYMGIFSLGMTADAKEKSEEKIEAGIYVNDIHLSGKTVSEAKKEIQAYVDSFADTQITLNAMDGETIVTTAEELGLKWKNQNIVEEAAGLGKDGDIVRCYKALKDLQYANKVYDVVFDFDRNKIKSLIEEQGAQYAQEAIDASLVRENDSFRITEGQTGIQVDVDASADAVYEYLTQNWDGSEESIDLVIEVVEPRGTAEELSMVTDVLGTFTTSYSTSGSSRSANVENGCKLINGCTLYPGDEFSAYEAVSPFSEANGYYMAGSYLNGQVVDSLGGGICQVSTTLYNAVLNAELEVTERYNHSMIVTYVEPSADAAIAESSGKDFKFVNNLDYPIYIEGKTNPDKKITFTIYGKETRDSNRKVTYESVVLETIAPDTEVIYQDAGQPVGYCSVQSAHIGYKAQLWKVVTVDGVEVSREQVNSSSYNKAPRSATVGIATADPAAYNAIMAAIATNSIDQVKAVAGAYQATADAAAAQAALEAAQAAAAAQAAQQEQQPPAPAADPEGNETAP
ncbi:MAG: VanW family protein [Blautia sp.]|nr:VanW family protein [Lachnoclostridium sp.]MCM1211660.1 VanW family protein [Blautia sp.]